MCKKIIDTLIINNRKKNVIECQICGNIQTTEHKSSITSKCRKCKNIGNHEGKIIDGSKILSSFTTDEINILKYDIECFCGNSFQLRHDQLNLILRDINRELHCKQCSVDKSLEKRKDSITQSQLNQFYNRYKNISKTKNREFLLSKSDFQKIINNSCYYCGAECSENSTYNYLECYNGIDRLNSSEGYKLSNCVPCCYKCNKMKMHFELNVFIKKCEYITYGNTLTLSTPIDYDINFSQLYRDYKYSSRVRNLVFELTEDEFINLKKQPCKYCGEYYKDFINGIDRVDNNEGYSRNNCIPCCRTCNIMKSNLTKEDFLNHCKKIINNLYGIR